MNNIKKESDALTTHLTLIVNIEIEEVDDALCTAWRSMAQQLLRFIGSAMHCRAIQELRTDLSFHIFRDQETTFLAHKYLESLLSLVSESESDLEYGLSAWAIAESDLICSLIEIFMGPLGKILLSGTVESHALDKGITDLFLHDRMPQTESAAASNLFKRLQVCPTPRSMMTCLLLWLTYLLACFLRQKSYWTTRPRRESHDGEIVERSIGTRNAVTFKGTIAHELRRPRARLGVGP